MIFDRVRQRTVSRFSLAHTRYTLQPEAKRHAFGMDSETARTPMQVDLLGNSKRTNQILKEISMKQKYIATIGALALTVPALAMAQTQQERSPAQTQPGQTQQEQQRQQQHQQDRTPGTAQPGAQQRQYEQHGQKTGGVDRQKLQGSFKADNLAGQDIKDSQGNDIGQVEDVLIDREGRVVAVLVTTGGVMGIGGETKAVEWDRLQVQVSQDNEIDRITTTMSEDEFDNLPEYEEGDRGATGRR
jgi:sporulation protein YlmC with PRC-barrel domain